MNEEIPDIIFLTNGGEPGDDIIFWCEDRITEDDIAFVRQRPFKEGAMYGISDESLRLFEQARKDAQKKLVAAILHAAMLEDVGTYDERADVATRIGRLQTAVAELTKERDLLIEQARNHFESIICPQCEEVQTAVVLYTVPWHSRVHVCEFCEHVIMESEWQRVDETGHTKGPWGFEERPYSSWGNKRYVVFEQAHGKRIATVSKNGVESYTISEANAALLAAAPDLLEACKVALDWRGLDGDGISDPTRQQLIKAVEKARLGKGEGDNG